MPKLTAEASHSSSPHFGPESLKEVTNWWIEIAPQLGNSDESNEQSHMEELESRLAELGITEPDEIADLILLGKDQLVAAAKFHSEIPDFLSEDSPPELKSAWETVCDENGVPYENRQLLFEQGRQRLIQQKEKLTMKEE